MLLIRGDDCTSLTKCLEASDHRYGVLSEEYFDIANSIFRDACMLEMDNRGQGSSQECLELKSWQDILENGLSTQEILKHRKVKF